MGGGTLPPFRHSKDDYLKTLINVVNVSMESTDFNFSESFANSENHTIFQCDGNATLDLSG